VKAAVRKKLADAEQKTLSAPVIFTNGERFLVTHFLKAALKECPNPFAISTLKDALAKLELPR